LHAQTLNIQPNPSNITTQAYTAHQAWLNFASSTSTAITFSVTPQANVVAITSLQTGSASTSANIIITAIRCRQRHPVYDFRLYVYSLRFVNFYNVPVSVSVS